MCRQTEDKNAKDGLRGSLLGCCHVRAFHWLELNKFVSPIDVVLEHLAA